MNNNYENAGKTIMDITASHAQEGVTIGDVAVDKAKGSAKLLDSKKQIQKRLADAISTLGQVKAGIEPLRKERAEISLAGGKDKELAALDKKIGLLNAEVDGLPDIIKLLEGQLIEADAKIKAECRDELLNRQKALARECQVLSEKLVKFLEQANGCNEVLQACYTRYKDLQKQTGISVLTTKFAEPSAEMLAYLFGHLKAELREGKHCRAMPRQGCPQI